MPHVYGANVVFETARDKLYATLDLLKTELDPEAYVPCLYYIYTQHSTVPIRVKNNAISLDFEACERAIEGASASNIAIPTYMMAFSVRVHTNYVGRYNDNIKAMRLLNSIDNWLSERLDLSDGYWIHEISGYETGLTFDESATVGAQMTVVIKKTIDHTQV